MQIETKVFGLIEIDEERAITLTEPMPGFAELSRFVVLVPDPENPFKWFQSLDRPEVCFLIADPRTFFPDYTVELRASSLPDLRIDDDSDSVVAVVLNMGETPEKITANLRAPIIFNMARNLARQVILEGVDYPVRTPIIAPQPQAAKG